MGGKKIMLWGMPDALMLIIEHDSGVVYENQVGGNICWPGMQEGVLAPVEVGPLTQEKIEVLPYPNGAAGISVEIADELDTLLASENTTRFLSVDRSRLHECWEAWIYVIISAPPGQSVSPGEKYFGPAYGFGIKRAVLTWINSD